MSIIKTVSKASNEMMYKYVHNDVQYSHPNFVAGERKQSFEEGVEFAEEFYPINEFPPPDNVEIIVKMVDEKHGIAVFNSKTKVNIVNGHFDFYLPKITHWRELHKTYQ